MTFEKLQADAILYREIQHKKKDIFMFKQVFSVEIGLNQVKYARIIITYVCFIALSLACPSGDV